MANERNLIPVYALNEAREMGRKGGIASGKARREKKLLKDMLRAFFAAPAKDASGRYIRDPKTNEVLNRMEVAVRNLVDATMYMYANYCDMKTVMKIKAAAKCMQKLSRIMDG